MQFFKRTKSFINDYMYSNNTPNIIFSGNFNCKLDNLTDKSSKLQKKNHFSVWLTYGKVNTTTQKVLNVVMLLIYLRVEFNSFFKVRH